jgi:hypothetical protein
LRDVTFDAEGVRSRTACAAQLSLLAGQRDLRLLLAGGLAAPPAA